MKVLLREVTDLRRSINLVSPAVSVQLSPSEVTATVTAIDHVQMKSRVKR